MQCSASCGGGVQQRLIKCVDTKADTDSEVDQAQCHHELKPVGSQKCNTQECESASPGEYVQTLGLTHNHPYGWIQEGEKWTNIYGYMGGLHDSVSQ